MRIPATGRSSQRPKVVHSYRKLAVQGGQSHSPYKAPCHKGFGTVGIKTMYRTRLGEARRAATRNSRSRDVYTGSRGFIQTDSTAMTRSTTQNLLSAPIPLTKPGNATDSSAKSSQNRAGSASSQIAACDCYLLASLTPGSSRAKAAASRTLMTGCPFSADRGHSISDAASDAIAQSPHVLRHSVRTIGEISADNRSHAPSSLTQVFDT